MKEKEVTEKLESMSNPSNVESMKRFGIKPNRAYGVKMPQLRAIAKEIGTDQKLAERLWKRGYRETMILASIIADKRVFTSEMTDEWLSDFYDWEICDQCCMNLFFCLPFAYEKCFKWSEREVENEKRAAFALMAVMAWKNKDIGDRELEGFFPIIEREATDERMTVSKGMSWALRQTGKRNVRLNKAARESALRIGEFDSGNARWIANNVLRELESEKVLKKLLSDKS